jgi:heat shock protein HslJ
MRFAVASLLALTLVAGCGADDDGDDTAAAGEAASFVGVPWVLSAGLDVDGWEAARPSATFTDETVGGSTGCNRYTASYTVDGDSLELGMIASTQIACVPPVDAVEREYLAALESVAAWQLDGTELVLLDGDEGELLRYGPANPVGDWEATAILSGTAFAAPLPGTEITATFTPEGRLMGSGGCNTYTTSYSTDQGAIEIEPPVATKKACVSPDGVMGQEAAYLAALPTAVSYRLDGGTLALLSADGTYVASFVRKR